MGKHAILPSIAYDGSPYQSLMLQAMRQAKGGVIGIGNKAAVSLRFDDWQDSFKATMFALLTARGLPFSLVTIACGPGTQDWWSAGTTWADWLSWIHNGGECWCHGWDHNDPTPQGYAGYVKNIVTSKALLEAQGVKVQGFSTPGCFPLTSAVPYPPDTFTTLFPGHTDYPGKLLLATYALSEGDAFGQTLRPIPGGLYHGLRYIGVASPGSAAQALVQIDNAISAGAGVEIMCHVGNLGQGGYETLANYTAVLDYIVAQRDAGLIEVLTPSGIMFADHSTSRLNLIHAGDFEGLTVVGSLAGEWRGFSALNTLGSGGGHAGDGFVHKDNTDGSTYVYQLRNDLQSLGLGGETFVFEGWAKSDAASTVVSRVHIKDNGTGGSDRLDLTLTRSAIPNTWTKVTHAFTLHPLTDTLYVGLGRTSGDGIDWDDVSVKKV